MKLSRLQSEYVAWMDIYFQEEFGQKVEVSDLEHIGVLYSTFEEYDEATDTYGPEHDLQVEANILNANTPMLLVYVDNKMVALESLGAEKFLDDVEGWTFDALYDWAVEKATNNTKLWKEVK